MGIGTSMDCCRALRRRVGARASWLSGWGLVLALGIAAFAAPASADWRLYGSADLGYSIGKTSVDGDINFDPPNLPIRGSDTDVSPLLGGAFGVAIPMDELAPVEVPRWLPDWDVRGEIEAVGLRSYDFRTRPIVPGNAKVNTDLDVWTVMANVYVDVPMRGLYRPISWTTSRLFGRWRLRTLKYVLDRTTFDVGLGIGVAGLDVTTSEADNSGNEKAYNFAWQVSPGFSYEVSDRVKLTLGYRYIDPGDADLNLRGDSLPNDGTSSVKIDPEIHEVRAGVRVEIWDFAIPWR